MPEVVQPTPVTTGSTDESEMDMEDVTKTVLEQSFANVSQMFGQSAARFNAGSELTANEAARMFQLETQLVGALAAARLDKSATADKVLELRSTRDQPQAA